MHRKKCKRLNTPGDAHELTFSCHNQQPFLLDKSACLKLCESIASAREIHNFDLWAYVIMPEHVHILIWPHEDNYSISKILTSIKQPVSKSFIFNVKRDNPGLLQSLATSEKNRPYRMWMAGGGYDRNFDTDKALKNSVEYIHANPVRRGLVENPEEWEWSSYRAWNDLVGCKMEVDIESFPFS